MKEMANNQILTRIDESCQIIYSNLQEDILDKIIPILDVLIAKLERINSLFSEQPSADSLLKVARFMHLQCTLLLEDISSNKKNLRNLCVFFNSQILKLFQQDPLQN
jgi:hypothetical protein